MKQKAFCRGMWRLQSVVEIFKKKKLYMKKIYISRKISYFQLFLKIFIKNLIYTNCKLSQLDVISDDIS